MPSRIARPGRTAAREAIAWGERARQELSASGKTSHARTSESRDRLTPQELQIAKLAAGPDTPRDRPSAVPHVPTVRSHLYRIFPKLGTSSRDPLRAAVDSSPRAGCRGSSMCNADDVDMTGVLGDLDDTEPVDMSVNLDAPCIEPASDEHRVARSARPQFALQG